jgi:hypothetical protein
LIGPIVSGEADLVIGSRFLQHGGMGGAPTYRKAGVKVITTITNRATNGSISDSQSGFRAYSKNAIAAISPAEMGMGASTEILIKARDDALRVMEVPVHVTYVANRPALNPVYQGVDVLLSTVKQLSVRRPLLFYGVPGILFVIVGLAFGAWTLQLYAATHQVVTNVALVAIGATIIGVLLLSTGTLLWVLLSVIKEGRSK